jgi:hypothetical protein
VKQFLETGIRTESIHFGSGTKLTYALETSSQLTDIHAQYSEGCIRVLMPVGLAQEWAGSDQISISVDRCESNGPSVLIEKDFKCLHDDESNSDPNHIPSKFGRSLA